MGKYTKQDIFRMVEEEDVEFIRLQFTDMFGVLKNVAITSSQLGKALDNKCMFDGSSVEGFVRIEESDMYLYPDYDTFEIFPWRPQQGKVARLICDVYTPDGKPFEGDPRWILKKVIKELVIQLEEGHYKRALRDAQSIYKAFSDLDKYDKEYQEALERLEELSSVNDRYKKLKSDCDDIASDIASIDEDLAKLKQEKLKVMSPKYKQKLKEIRKNLRKVDEDFHNKELELENYNWLINDPLGNNGIKAYLFDSSLEFLNKCLDKYSEVLGFRIEFNIDLGTARKEFVTLIERDGMIIDYDELSGGEKQLVCVAMAFAMNEALTASKGINLAFLDEVFESLSSDNIEVVTSLIRHIFKEKTLFLITHLDSLPLGNTKILQVEKTQGLSRYQLL